MNDMVEGRVRYREFGEARQDEFLAKGYLERNFFPHRVYHLPKCGPDGYKLAQRMCDPTKLDQMWELVLYATGPVLRELPQELFFDDDVIWHQQHFGRVGQVATVNLVLDGRDLYTAVHLSDLVQRISRRRDRKTRVETRFRGWNHMLLNAIFNFAVENKVRRVHTPTAEFALRNTDPTRDPQTELFDRIYNRSLHDLFPAQRSGDWWVTSVGEAASRVVQSEIRWEWKTTDGPTVAVCHDIERELGHEASDPAYSLARQHSQSNLEEMLTLEAEFGCKATYNVVGTLLNEVRKDIESRDHSIAFHSYDHSIESRRPARWRWLRRRPSMHASHTAGQLEACRAIDYRIKGYSVPRSLITPELKNEILCFHNFEWLASSRYSLNLDQPEMQSRLVKIPIHLDDFELFRGNINFEEWEKSVLELVSSSPFTAVDLHDCYGQAWLPHYRQLLARVGELARFMTLDEVAADITFAAAV